MTTAVALMPATTTLGRDGRAAPAAFEPPPSAPSPAAGPPPPSSSAGPAAPEASTATPPSLPPSQPRDPAPEGRGGDGRGDDDDDAVGLCLSLSSPSPPSTDDGDDRGAEEEPHPTTATPALPAAIAEGAEGRREGSASAGSSSSAEGSTTAAASRLEERIARLEASLDAMTRLCRGLMRQQPPPRPQRRRERSGEGSEETDASLSSLEYSSPNPPLQYCESDPRSLSRWPPTHHTLLDSPEASARQRRRSGHLAKKTSGGLSSKGKTMSMVLLDIEPGESRGPNMIPFAPDLDTLGDLDASGRRSSIRSGVVRRGSSGGVSAASRSGSESASSGSGAGERGERRRPSPSSESGTESGGGGESADGSSGEGSPVAARRGPAPRRLSSSLREEGRRGGGVECQAYTTTHLEALRLRREAGKDRAYSFNDASARRGAAEDGASDGDSRDGSVVVPVPARPGTSASDAPDGAVREEDSAASADGAGALPADDPASNRVRTTSAMVQPRGGAGEPKELDIVMPDLSPSDEARAGEEASPAEGARAGEAAPTGAEAGAPGAAKSEGTSVIAHSPSCASNMSSDTTKTLKAGNTIGHVASRRQRLRSGSASGKERSDVPAPSEGGSSGADEAAPPPPVDVRRTRAPSKAEAKGKSPRRGEVPKSSKSPRKPPPDAAGGGTDGPRIGDAKAPQTMREYVLHDLLNVDSRNHDGSATEDVDAAMEEFLRIPSKLEGLMAFSLAVCVDSFLYAWAMLPLKFVWGWICLACSVLSPRRGIRGVRFRRRHLYPMMQSVLIWFVYSQVLCPISIGKLYHWIRGQAMLKLYVLIAIVEVFDRLLCSFGQDAWDSLYWNTTRRPRHPRMFVSIIVVGMYVTIHSLFLFVHVATLSVAVNSADNALLTLLISGNFAEIKSTVFKKYNKQNLFKITTSDICERFKLALFLLLILFLNQFQGEMTTSMVQDYYSMCGIVFAAELISDWIKHSFITKFNSIQSSTYFDYALVLSGDVTGVGHEGLNLDYTHAAVKRLGLAQIPLVCVTARYLHEAVRFAVAFRGDDEAAVMDDGRPLAALAHLIADGNQWKLGATLLRGMGALVAFKITLGMCVRFAARQYLGGAGGEATEGAAPRKSSTGAKATKDGDVKKRQ